MNNYEPVTIVFKNKPYIKQHNCHDDYFYTIMTVAFLAILFFAVNFYVLYNTDYNFILQEDQCKYITTIFIACKKNGITTIGW